MKNTPLMFQIHASLFLITHISPEEILWFQNMQQTKKLDDMPHQSSQEVWKEPGHCKAPLGVWSHSQMAVADLLLKFVTHLRCFPPDGFFLVLTHVSPPCTSCSKIPPLSLDPVLNCFLSFWLFFWHFHPFLPYICLQAWQSGRLGSTLTILGGMETMSAWRQSVSITGREFARGPRRWRLALQIGWQRRTPGRSSTPVWRRASGASTRNSPTAASAPTTMSASSVPQVAVMRAAEGPTSCHCTYMNMQANTCMNTLFKSL